MTKTFRERFDELEKELSNAYSELRAKKEKYIFTTDADIENGDYSDFFEVRNDNTGDVYDVHIMQVDEKGIKIVEANDDEKKYYISLNDLACIESRLLLIEYMQDYEQ